jgi:hypothetical protein
MTHLPPGQARLDNILARKSVKCALHARAEGGQAQVLLGNLLTREHLVFERV